MCGIAGGFWPTKIPEIESRVVAALSELGHRGPDDRGLDIVEMGRGTLAIGQTRLSIIDLSSGGHQPMSAPGGALTMVYNGELYNYRELREELKAGGRVFETESDTEVLLAAWAEWGKACLPRLEGMFAFVIYDRRSGTLVCVRDAFGIKPLFIHPEEGKFLFASEQRALGKLRSSSARPDLQGAYDYLVHGAYDTGPGTFIEGVRHLPPGCLIEVDLQTCAVSKPEMWWRAPVAATSVFSFNQAVEATREQFLHNVKLHLRSDVPLGAALSGGVDSAAVVCAIRHVDPSAEIHTFSYIADDPRLSEEKWVDLVNEAAGATAHKVHLGPHDLAKDLDALVRAQGEPFGSTSIYAQYAVFRRAREEGIKVTLEGQGADELLAGYDGYPGQRMLSLFENGRLPAMAQFARKANDWPGRSQRRAWMEVGRLLLPDSLYSRARGALGRDFRPRWLDIPALEHAGVRFSELRAPRDSASHGRRVVEQLAYSLQERGLSHLLRHGDRNSMAFSIEGRVPFLTLPMANLTLSFPENYLISDEGETKRVFRAAMRGIVPEPVLDRRDKVGFATPELAWLRTIAPIAREWLESADGIPFLHSRVLLDEFNDMVAGREPFSWQAWRWINYARWYRLQGF
jgi:asparagine synthase (glutamine-hydrolysing)